MKMEGIDFFQKTDELETMEADPDLIDMNEKIRLTGEEIQKIIGMAESLRDGLIKGDFIESLKKAQKKGNSKLADKLKNEALERLDGGIAFVEIMGGENGLELVKNKLESIKEYIIQKF